MMARVSYWGLAVRRVFNRSEWLVRVFRLPRAAEPPTAPGLVLIQIDGLSQSQLERALAAGEMPFLDRLRKREGYRLHTLYSGLPSTTAAVQAELFYGVDVAVPAFGFRDAETDAVFRMAEPHATSTVERTLKARGTSLLQGGSAYLDVYTGGAAEPHFCAASLGWNAVLRGANPLAIAFLVIANAYSFLRTAALLALEVVLAFTDFARGIIAGRDFLKELKFVPTRVAICILLRELATIGAKMDVARGLPVIHLNFLGYDEQSHRRGPSSLFAHWTLKGIDDSIARIWRETRRSPRRDYDLWVYGDHGQADVMAYPKRYGRSIEAAVAEVYGEIWGQSPGPVPTGGRGIETQRVRQLGGRRVQQVLPVCDDGADWVGNRDITVTAMGPIGFIYLGRALEPDRRNRFAEALVRKAHVPMVLAATERGKGLAWTLSGRFQLPDDRAVLFGRDHPFLDAVAADMVKLCHHPDAGRLVICGWRDQAQAISFPIENGAHGGASVEETRAFAMLPDHVVLPRRAHSHLRPRELRAAALDLLGRGERPTIPAKARPGRRPRGLRVMTYNVHSCIGMDGRLSPERIARVIARYEPDVVALQELDVGRPRTGGGDQAHLIARRLEMAYHFHPTIRIAEERYGNAILSRMPMRLVKAGKLPGLASRPRLEPRGAIWAAIEVDGYYVQIFNTHLGLRRRERLNQVEALLGDGWLGHPDCRGPIVLLGDLNAGPTSPVCRRLSQLLRDAQTVARDHRPLNTWFGPFPTSRIDHVMVDSATRVLRVEVPKTGLTRRASDHLPLLVELAIDPAISDSGTVEP